MEKKTILVVDDIEINRMLLAEIFGGDYRIIEAENGEQAIGIINSGERLAAVLLDLFMPGINGIGVLKDMNESGRIKTIPVFLITAADSMDMLLEGYNLGAIDVIRKPFMAQFLKCRVDNVVELYAHRNELEEIVAEKVAQLNRINYSMLQTLATVIEFRDCETGEHVKRICGLTDLIMTKVSEMYPEYRLPREEIERIVVSAVLHDIGKISIPDSILNKPGKLTKEEYETMKLHTVKGCEILEQVADVLDAGIYNYSYDICRHHHERWDGKGYPDGVRGDEISIWAQVVSVADVYDALTSERVYKKAFDPDTAVRMIYNGECGAFNPKVLEAFQRVIER